MESSSSATSISVLEQSLRATSTQNLPKVKSTSKSTSNPTTSQGMKSSLSSSKVMQLQIHQPQQHQPASNQFLQMTSVQSLVPVQSSIPFCPGIEHPYGLGVESLPSSEQMLNYRYSQLLEVIKEMSQDLKPVYASSSRTSSDRFKRGMTQAKLLIRECLLESERSMASSSNSRE